MLTSSFVAALRRSLAAAALLGACLSAPAQMEPKAIQALGGVYAPDCGNALGPQLKLLGDALVVQDKGQPLLTGRNPQPAPAGAFGPTGFEAALTGLVAPGEAMTFVFTRDASGLYVTVDGSPKVMAMLPPALNGRRVRHCDAAGPPKR
jgi:hypothetical protein